MISSNKSLQSNLGTTKQVKSKMKQIEKTLKKQEEKLGRAVSSGSMLKETFETTFKQLRKKWIEHRENKAIILHEVSTKERTEYYLALSLPIKMDRVIIGSGTSATMLFDKIDPKVRCSVLVLNDVLHPSTWLKGSDKRLMTQSELLQAPGFLEPNSFIKDEEKEFVTNPYHYSRMRHVALAQIEKQNELNMPIVNLKVVTIQALNNLSGEDRLTWEDKSYPYRIPVSMPNDKDQNIIKYLYTHHIDICVGMGKERRLSSDQISSELEANCLQNKKLIYDVQDAKQLQDGVIFYGGSAGNGTTIAEIEARRKKELLSDGPQPIIAGWYTRGKGDFDENRMLMTLNRLVQSTIKMEKEKKEANILHDGYILKKVEESSDGQLLIIFEEQGSQKQKTVLAPQLVVSIAQDPLDLTKDLQKTYFIPIIQDDIPLGLASEDQKIIVWGAASAFPAALSIYFKNDAKKVDEINRLALAHAKTLPHESKVAPGIFSVYKKTEQLANVLFNVGIFPLRKEVMRERFFRQINAASKNELVGILESVSKISKPYEKKDLEKYANKIIAFRSKMVSIELFGTGGIHQSQQLLALKNEIPIELLNAIRAYYFPHSSPFKMSPRNDGRFDGMLDHRQSSLVLKS
jgi:hypothetical protein